MGVKEKKAESRRLKMIKASTLPGWLKKLARKKQHYYHKMDHTLFCPITLHSTGNPWMYPHLGTGQLFNFCPMCGKKITGFGQEEEWIKHVDTK